MKPVAYSIAIFCTLLGVNNPADEKHLRLFEPGKEGYPRYRIPSLVVTGSDALLAVCEGRADGGGLTGNGCGPAVGIQLESGRLFFPCYHAEGGQGKTKRSHAIFNDGHGMNWNEKRFDHSLFDAHCQASLLKLPPTEGNPRWLFCHPAGPKRHNLTVRLSRDEGRTWNAGSLLLREGDGQYSSLALLPNGRVGIFYDCWENRNYQLYFATFSTDELR